MKKFLNWLKSPSSDFVLFVILLVLANLVGHRAFMRFDLTGPKSYSLSPASRQVVKTLNEPLGVTVFFTDNLPAPYNSTAQYVRDILVEYKGAANKNFTYSFPDMDKEENQKLAAGYGLHQVQIQEVKNNEVGFKQAWMGIAVTYADSVKTLDSITSSDGFEYKLTTTISGMISTADTLAGLGKDDTITLTLYATEKLSQFNIAGFDQIDSAVQKAYYAVNRKNQNRITYGKSEPAQNEIKAVADKYGLTELNWKEKDGSDGEGIIGLVLEHGNTFRLVPLSFQRSIFGYAIAGLDNLETTLNDSLQSLLSKSTEIGYITGHGEPDISDEEKGAGRLASLVQDMYTFKNLDLTKDDIPVNMASILINGAKTDFTDAELYKIDQFVMKGGNVMFFTDPFDVVQPQSYYQQAQYNPITCNISRLINAYGAKTGTNYVMDENCYVSRQQGYGNLNLYWAPVLQRDNFSSRSLITKNLGYVIFLQSSSVDIDDTKLADAKATILAKSSPKSWLVSSNIQLNPMMTVPPSDKASQKSENLAVLLEGKFTSAFTSNPNDEIKAGDKLSAQTHIAKSTLPGKVFVCGTSAITSPQLIDEKGSEPVSLFVRNTVDYMNGNGDLCTMRTKGLSLNTLSNTTSVFAFIAKYFNEFGLALLTAIAGFIVWRMRTIRRRRIHDRYNPNDTREVTK